MINFYCPLGQSPNGGHKVIYNTVEELNSLGVNAQVIHPIPKYKIKWFKTKAKVNSQKKLNSSDYFIIPEVCLSFFEEHEIDNYSKYSILVQNGYLFLGSENPRNRIKTFYDYAEFIFCVSNDSAEVIRMLDPSLSNKIIVFEPSMTKFCSEKVDFPKTKTICYMPRKNSLYSDIVINLLEANLPKNWKIIEIHGQTENKVIEILKESTIFLNFSDLEGNPAPPLEAAVLGNIVIGNHGNGAKSYWHEPLFIKVNQEDLKGYVTKTLELVNNIDLNQNMLLNYEKNRLDLISTLQARITLSNVISNLVSSDELTASNLQNDKEHFYSLSLFKYFFWRIKVKLNTKTDKAPYS